VFLRKIGMSGTLLDRHHDGSEIHGQLALSANVPAAAQASIMRMRRNPSGLDLPLAQVTSACRFNLGFDLRKLCAEPIKLARKSDGLTNVVSS
jgi:hypothetical protein